MANLVNITKFRWWANKVLPAVYDDSLSYYEVLTKVCAKLDEIIDNENEQNKIIENLPTDVSQFAEMLEEFKTTMETEFDTFTDAINASIEEFESEVNEKIVTDTTPTESSLHLVTSGGVYASIKAVTDSLVKDAVPTANSHNYVESGGVYSAINDAINNLDSRFNAKQDKLTFDTTPTENSNNPVYSGGIYTALLTLRNIIEIALNSKQDTLTWDNTPTLNSPNPVTSDGIANALDEKQDTLVFDNVPTEGSTNPVTSDGIRQAIDEAVPDIPIDPTPTEGSDNAVSSGGTWQALVELAENIDNLLSDKQNLLTWDLLPVENSLNPVTSGGVWEAIARIAPSVVIDAVPTEGSAHAVSSGGVYSWTLNITDALDLAIQGKQDTLTFDTEPTENSQNMVNSGAVWLAIQNVTITTDATPTQNSTNPVQSGGVYTALLGKQDSLTFDSSPTPGSNNPVTSNGIGYAIVNAIGGVNALTFLQAYDSSVAQLSAGYVFTPAGAYNLYTNVMNVISSTRTNLTTKVLPSQTTDFSIATTDWTNGQATVTGTFEVGTGYSNEIVPTIGERATWDYYGVYPVSITASSITFQCATTPATALTFKVMQSVVQNA